MFILYIGIKKLMLNYFKPIVNGKSLLHDCAVCLGASLIHPSYVMLSILAVTKMVAATILRSRFDNRSSLTIACHHGGYIHLCFYHIQAFVNIQTIKKANLYRFLGLRSIYASLPLMAVLP